LLIGSVIGKGGAKIRSIQDVSGARMVASKEMLPQSTERIVEVSGNSESIRMAITEISKCLIEDWDRSQGTVLYHPGTEGMIGHGFPGQQQGYQNQGQSPTAFGARRISATGSFGGARRQSGDGRDFSAMRSGSESPMARRSSGGGPNAGGEGGSGVSSSDPNYREQKISIPADMVYVSFSSRTYAWSMLIQLFHHLVDALLDELELKLTKSVVLVDQRFRSPKLLTMILENVCLSYPDYPSESYRQPMSCFPL
jgi:hypothetical protein